MTSEFEADGIDDLEMYAGAEPIELKDNRDPPSDSSATSPKDKQSSEDRAEAIEAAIRSSVEQLLEREKTKLMEGRISFEEAWTPERVAEWFRVHWGQAMMRAEAQALEVSIDKATVLFVSFVCPFVYFFSLWSYCRI